MTAAAVISGDERLEQADLFFVLSRDGDREVIKTEQLLLASLLLQQSLFDLAFLFLPDLDHHLLHTRVHLLPVFLSGLGLPSTPGMFAYVS